MSWRQPSEIASSLQPETGLLSVRCRETGRVGERAEGQVSDTDPASGLAAQHQWTSLMVNRSVTACTTNYTLWLLVLIASPTARNVM